MSQGDILTRIHSLNASSAPEDSTVTSLVKVQWRAAAPSASLAAIRIERVWTLKIPTTTSFADLAPLDAGISVPVKKRKEIVSTAERANTPHLWRQRQTGRAFRARTALTRHTWEQRASTAVDSVLWDFLNLKKPARTAYRGTTRNVFSLDSFSLYMHSLSFLPSLLSSLSSPSSSFF